MDGFPLIPYGASVFPASYFPLGIPDLVVVQLYFYGIFSRYFSDTVKNRVSSIRVDWTGLHRQEGGRQDNNQPEILVLMGIG
ncbi:TPA: hypothetical protein ACLBHA_001652 [Neisseria meningitidis]